MATAISLGAEKAAYIDPEADKGYPLDLPRWRSETGAPLMINALPGMNRAGIDRTERSLWRYRTAFPVTVATPISMGETNRTGPEIRRVSW